MNKKILVTGAVLGVIAIVLGAFAAHGLEKLIDLDAQQTFETGVRYQMYHALFLLFIGSSSKVTLKAKKTIFYLVIIGLLFFSGSIYGLATNSLTSFDFKQITMITPLGGFLLILAWILLTVNIVKTKID
jgi:uncharacterized membrane protein YgdD (TMEM256/DUF423 family)